MYEEQQVFVCLMSTSSEFMQNPAMHIPAALCTGVDMLICALEFYHQTIRKLLNKILFL